MSLDNFGIQFATRTIQRFWQTAVTPAVTNTDYEGEIKQAGDRVRILSFLNDIPLEDYVAGTDMTVYSPVDAEDELVVEKRKSYSFVFDRTEDLFTYAGDIQENRIENANKTIERTIDTYVLEKAGEARPGSWVGIDVRVAGGTQTAASVTTTATGGTVGLNGDQADGVIGSTQLGDGTNITGGFEDPQDIGKPIRFTSGTSIATEWYRITAVTDTNTATIENWDAATSGADIPNGDILRGLGGAPEFLGGATQTDGKVTTESRSQTDSWGWEFQSGRATAIAAGTAYTAMTVIAEKLDFREIPETDRHLTVPSEVIRILRNASELQPAIAMAYEGVILNGRVGRAAGFDIHQAVGSRMTTRLEKSSVAAASGDNVLVDGARATVIMANHISFMTFAYKWAESRIVDVEDQFAKKYQGLHLFGAKVPEIRRNSGVVWFGTV